MDGQDLTKGDIRRQLWSLAWPMMLSVFFYTLYNLVDTYWVSKISPEAIAAVSISQIALFIMIAFGFGLMIGSSVIMSMHIGAKNMHEAERTLGQSFVLAAMAGIFFSIISLVFRDFILTASGATGAIFDPALEYFIITAAGSTLFFILMAVMFVFNAQGDTFTLTKLFALSTLVNCILDPIMIFGWLGFPALGVAGAAYATLISQALFIVISLYSLSRPRRMVKFHFRNLSLKWESVKKVMNIGFPASLTDLVFPLGLAALTLIASLTYFEPGAIAFSLGFRIEFFAFLPAAGFGFAAMAMIGQNIGAGNLPRARECFNKALKYGFLGATGIGVLAALFGNFLIGAFTDDPTVTNYTFSYLWTVALISYGFLAAIMVEASAFQAIGRSWPGFWIFMLRSAIVTTPLALLFTQFLNLPIIFMWLSITVGNVVAAVVGYFWIRKAFATLDLATVPVHHEEERSSL
ncbi:hypothetical protein COU18_00855 [Candidatus Kaiserbacteria bacterium CG10_big_fil_rev_8_21_14_0_10_51_14]|uniref:Multidrug-efflux transporter n=1 Tax=Candidatus Kaiserbacteria bacterium CG10_big_fil_rev_8_21_14_0_10_51_14 TaxID=1974610 RepID=A0A2H0UBZ4_9BACT|nr:MAG: hypothetical protein COU18_00855 [Candidatus Kaiserbacteria bacterium CG10_big_fil_rev_8_21_14_0_10_51_14]